MSDSLALQALLGLATAPVPKVHLTPPSPPAKSPPQIHLIDAQYIDQATHLTLATSNADTVAAQEAFWANHRASVDESLERDRWKNVIRDCEEEGCAYKTGEKERTRR